MILSTACVGIGHLTTDYPVPVIPGPVCRNMPLELRHITAGPTAQLTMQRPRCQDVRTRKSVFLGRAIRAPGGGISPPGYADRPAGYSGGNPVRWPGISRQKSRISGCCPSSQSRLKSLYQMVLRYRGGFSCGGDMRLRATHIAVRKNKKESLTAGPAGSERPCHRGVAGNLGRGGGLSGLPAPSRRRTR